jgi:hypothetical protein
LAAFLSACQNMPEPYAPPEQRQTFEHFRPYRVSQIIRMDDADVDAHIVSGVGGAGSPSWRWTEQRPTVRVLMRSAEHLHYTIDFTIPGVTFDQTGPVTMSFFVGDHLLDSVRYTEPGIKHFEKEIPAGWVEANQPLTVSAAIDKMYLSKDDGTKLGFILTSIGLTQQ